jgi:catechol 2,3-dioxygenase-like lactoylglutathione lyase family enzyme
MADFEVHQIDHVELFVPDQRAAAAWYERILGLRVLDDFAHWADGGPLMVVTPRAHTKLALFEGEPLDTPARGAFRRVAFQTDGAGFAAFLDRLDDLDLRSESGNRVTRDDWVDHGEAMSIYFSDPWHHRFEITTYETARARQLIG